MLSIGQRIRRKDLITKRTKTLDQDLMKWKKYPEKQVQHYRLRLLIKV